MPNSRIVAAWIGSIFVFLHKVIKKNGVFKYHI